MTLFPGPSICITYVNDRSRRYSHDNVLHWHWSSILKFNTMYMYHYPNKMNQGGSGDIFFTETSDILWGFGNTSQFTCKVTCPVWSLGLADNSITHSAKVRRMARIKHCTWTNTLQPASWPAMPSQAASTTKPCAYFLGRTVTYDMGRVC